MDSKRLESVSKMNRAQPVDEAQEIIVSYFAGLPRGVLWRDVAPALAGKLGFGLRRLKALRYGEARRVDAGEMDRLRSLLPAPAAKEERYAAEMEIRADRLEAIDPDFYRAEIDRYRQQAVRLRNLSR